MQTKYTALESKSRVVVAQQNQAVAGATFALSNLGARLTDLVEQLIASYNISEQELDVSVKFIVLSVQKQNPPFAARFGDCVCGKASSKRQRRLGVSLIMKSFIIHLFIHNLNFSFALERRSFVRSFFHFSIFDRCITKHSPLNVR